MEDHSDSQDNTEMESCTNLDDSCGSTSPTMKKLPRFRTTEEQQKTLLEYFAKHPKPDTATRKYLATLLNMTERSVQIWFQNKRAKLKTINSKLLSPYSLLARQNNKTASEVPLLRQTNMDLPHKRVRDQQVPVPLNVSRNYTDKAPASPEPSFSDPQSPLDYLSPDFSFQDFLWDSSSAVAEQALSDTVFVEEFISSLQYPDMTANDLYSDIPFF